MMLLQCRHFHYYIISQTGMTSTAVPNRTSLMLRLMAMQIKKDRDGDIIMKDYRPPMARVLFPELPSTTTGSVFRDLPLPTPTITRRHGELSDSDESDDDDGESADEEEDDPSVGWSGSDDSDDDGDDQHNDDYDADTQPYYTYDIRMPTVIPGRVRVASM